MSKKKLSMLIGCLIILWTVNAQNNSQIILSGRLNDFNGVGVGMNRPDTLDVSVMLYDDSLAGSIRYTENFIKENNQAVVVNGGQMNIVLGTGASSENLRGVISENENLWVEIIIDGDTLSRSALLSSPYSVVNNNQNNTKVSIRSNK